MKNLLSSVALGWFLRRILDWGGWVGTFAVTLIGIYNGLSPAQQQLVSQALTGDWQSITLGALIPFAGLVISQVVSFRSTVKPAVVTTDGEKVALDKLSAPAQVTVERAVDTAPRGRTLIDMLYEKLGRR